MKIYRVILKTYFTTIPHTMWHTSEQYCKDYIKNCEDSYLYSIEESEVIVDG